MKFMAPALDPKRKSDGSISTEISSKTSHLCLDLSKLDLKELPEELPPLNNLLDLNLSKNNFSTCPERLKEAKNLRVINLSHNRLTSIDDLLENYLKLVRTVDVRKNKITTIPKPISLHHLKELYASENRLEEFPIWLIEESFCLINVDFSNNPLFADTNAIPEPPSSGKVGKIFCLQLNNTGMSDKHITLLKYFPSVIKLDVGNYKPIWLNRIAEIPSKYLPPNLQELKMRNTTMTGLSDVSLMKDLILLDVSNNPLSFLPNNLCLSSSLQTLILTKCSLYGLPENFGSIITLTYLDLSHNDIANLPKSFEKLINLIHLDLYDNSLYSIPSLEGLSKLQKLDICQNDFEPALIMGSPVYIYKEMNEALRSEILEERISGPKVVEKETYPYTEDFDQDFDSSSSLSNAESYSSFGVLSNSNKANEEFWESLEEDSFDPTKLETNQRVIINSPEGPLKDCLDTCPKNVMESPHFYHPGMDRLQFPSLSNQNHTDIWYHNLNVVEGQFDDI